MSGILMITGGGRGIGAETALKAADAGWDVCVNYQGNAGRAEEVVSDVMARGQRAIAVQADISVEADVIRLFETCDAKLGVPTGLVNSAGILGPLTRIDEIGGDDLTRHMMINVVGSMLCAREAVLRMSTRHGGDGGVIVNLSSRTSDLGGAGASVHYGASKGAINSFTFGLAQEVAAEGVRYRVAMRARRHPCLAPVPRKSRRRPHKGLLRPLLLHVPLPASACTCPRGRQLW